MALAGIVGLFGYRLAPGAPAALVAAAVVIIVFAVAYRFLSEDGQNYADGLMSDLGFSFVTFLVLGTIVGVFAMLLIPTLEPIVGDFVAGIWWLPTIIGYCAWQFLRFRGLRRADSPTPGNPRLD
jgi:hypothetical protein